MHTLDTASFVAAARCRQQVVIRLGFWRSLETSPLGQLKPAGMYLDSLTRDAPVLGPQRAPRPGAVSTPHGRSALEGPEASGSVALNVDRVSPGTPSHGFKVTSEA